MNHALKYYSDVKDGKLQPSVTKSILSDLKAFEGKRIEITLTNKKSTRSDKQNRYYWAMITILSNDTGFTKDEMHDIIKYKFLKEPIVIGDTEEFVIKSTTKLTKSEFADFTSQLQQWASQTLNIYLPNPEEQTIIEL